VTETRSLYDRAGGAPFFEALVARFYDERGHPRLRMRHAPFAIGPLERDRWLVHMRAAIAALAPPADVADELQRYVVMAADAMRNRD
jgi:hemoglobin